MARKDKKPDDRQWDLLLDELIFLTGALRKLSPTARERAREPMIDGYPTRSMPESSIAAGRQGDPTVWSVQALAGGRDRADGDQETRPDHWLGPKDPVFEDVGRMEDFATRALPLLRGAVAAAERAQPPRGVQLPDRERCAACGVLKTIVTAYGERPGEWNQGEGKCATCVRRLSKAARKRATVGPV